MTTRLHVTLPTVAFSFASQAVQYPPDGPDGLGYFRGEVGDGTYVDCLLYRQGGAVVGILNHFPTGSPWDKPGDFMVMVRPDHRRQGVGRALLSEADKRWALNFEQQDYTAAGAATVVAYLIAKKVSRSHAVER